MDKIVFGYVFRIDDITPGMNWINFYKIEKIFDKYNIKPIIGVVPDNKDVKLDGYGKINNFWGKIKELNNNGWIVAQHGYQHMYSTDNKGIIGLNKYSEFAGITYNQQLDKIKKGKEILEKNIGNKIKRWMAPAHSFDKITCQILKKLGFEYITDGIALYPFEKYGLKWLPQQIWKPQQKKYGIRTICLHINNYDDKFICNIEKFCEKNHDLIIKDFGKLNYKNNVMKRIGSYLFKISFWSKIYIYKIKTKLLG